MREINRPLFKGAGERGKRTSCTADVCMQSCECHLNAKLSVFSHFFKNDEGNK
jgi:hypothetical protein